MNVGILKIIEEIGLIITEIMIRDGVEMWADPLRELISWI